jgi:hypothetical protein
MKAISLSRPWPYSFFHLGKGLENRSRKDGRIPDICRHRGPLLLHAAKSWDKGAADWMFERRLLPPLNGLSAVQNKHAHPVGIVGRCRAVGMIRGYRSIFDQLDFDVQRPDELDKRWWMGGYALVLEDIEEFATPIPCRGHLGLWTPPPDVLEALPASVTEETCAKD